MVVTGLGDIAPDSVVAIGHGTVIEGVPITITEEAITNVI